MPEDAPQEQVHDDVPEATEGAPRETVLRHLKLMRQRTPASAEDSARERGDGADPAPPT
jgi:hypothetical protein